jgi:hypothetical protein
MTSSIPRRFPEFRSDRANPSSPPLLPDDRGRVLLLRLEPAWLCRATGISAKCTSSMSSANVNSTRETSWDPAVTHLAQILDTLE